MKLDEIYGIDRYKDSPEFGNKVVPEAYIWDKPGGKATGMIRHGVQVDVIDDKMVDGFSWCAVTGFDAKRERVSGWLRSSLLKYAGESEFK